MDDVYLLNNPFTFQAMEKHSAYCAMIRLGLKVPETWMVPHKVPTTVPRREYQLERFEHMASRYNLPFDLEEVAEQVGYPLYMKPFDGGQWVGVTRIQRRGRAARPVRRLRPAADAPAGVGRGLRRRSSRSLSIGAETMVMNFEPDAPMHLRYEVAHDFLTPETGWEVVTISRLVNAFFRWEFNSCESLVRGTGVHPIDYANASPDVALTSLHYYFPWAMEALVKWCAFCTVTGRADARSTRTSARYFDIGDRDDLTYEDKLREYRRLADDYFQVEEYEEFCATQRSPALREVVVDYFGGPGVRRAARRDGAVASSRRTSTRRWSRGTAGWSGHG